MTGTRPSAMRVGSGGREGLPKERRQPQIGCLWLDDDSQKKSRRPPFPLAATQLPSPCLGRCDVVRAWGSGASCCAVRFAEKNFVFREMRKCVDGPILPQHAGWAGPSLLVRAGQSGYRWDERIGVEKMQDRMHPKITTVRRIFVKTCNARLCLPFYLSPRPRDLWEASG